MNKIIGNMIKDRKSSPAKNRNETLLDCILSYTDDEEIQFADALEFSTSGQYVLDYCKNYLSIYLSMWSNHAKFVQIINVHVKCSVKNAHS